MKNIFLLLLTVIAFQLNAQSSAANGAAKFAPEDGKKLLIIGQDLGSVGGLATHSNGYVDNVDCHIPAGVTSYTSIGSLDGLTVQANWGAGDVRAQSYLEEETFDNSFIVIGLYMVDLLEATSDGNLDNNIRNLANWTKGQDRPVFIRIGYEFEGPWNNYTPNAFKNAWQHFVHIFDEEEVKNAAYVWQSAGLNYSNISDWYPGDEYVNWVGYSQFDGTNMGQSIKNFAIQHDKPIMIAEAAPRVDLGAGNGIGHWNNWYVPLFNEIYDNDRIKAFAYINADWDNQPMWTGQGWGDSRVQVDDYIKGKWELEIKKEPWLTATEDLFLELNYETWLTVATEDINTSQNDDLEVIVQGQEINVRLKSGKDLDSISVWDFNGKLLFSDDAKKSEYQITNPSKIMGGIIIRAKSEGQILVQKKIM